MRLRRATFGPSPTSVAPVVVESANGGPRFDGFTSMALPTSNNPMQNSHVRRRSVDYIVESSKNRPISKFVHKGHGGQYHHERISGLDRESRKRGHLGQVAFPVGRVQVHLQELISQLSVDECIDEIDFGIDLGHVYGHLNRCWNGRRLTGDAMDQWYSDENSSFPKDLPIT